jgi:glycosyltransferase involved in cell wall biosynthesis
MAFMGVCRPNLYASETINQNKDTVSKQKISLFIDGHTFDKEFQGTHGFIRGLYTALSRKYDDDLEIYAGAHNTANLQKELSFIDPNNILPYKKHPAGFMRFITDIPAHIKKYNFDFAHFQYTAPAPQAGCRYIVTLHDILFNDFREDFPLAYRLSRNIFFRKSFKKAAIKTTVSSYSRHRIARHYHIPAEKIDVIPSGPMAAFGSVNNKEEAAGIILNKYGIQNFILYVSRIEPRKNQQLLLKKFLELELYKKGIAVVFIGKHSISSVLFQQLLKSLTPEQKGFVHWLEQVPPEDIEAFYRSCRLFAYPSRAEGFGLPPLEAALCKVPVLCSSATAMHDYTFFDPYRFDPADENEFSYKLKSMLDSPPAASQLEQVAISTLENYSWERTADKFYQLLKREQ